MKYTKEQRREIYLKAADFTVSTPRVLCYSLSIQMGRLGRINTELITKLLPEFRLFKPERSDSNGRWYGHHDIEENNNHRINCLLLCAEMCRD